MNEITLEKLLEVVGPTFPAVARKLETLPEDHPIKVALAEQEAKPPHKPELPIAAKIKDLEERIEALEDNGP